jgi:hypothetical protein
MPVETRPATPMERSRFLLMMEASQRRAFCICCICIPRNERRRAKRIFKIARRVSRDLKRDKLEAIIANEPPTPV